MPPMSKNARLAVFLQRLDQLPAFGSHDEAYEAGLNLINAVENELTSTPYAPDSWRSDGRLNWPQADRSAKASPSVTKYRNLAHETYIGSNGSLEIRARGGATLLSKPGRDGRTVSDLLGE